MMKRRMRCCLLALMVAPAAAWAQGPLPTACATIPLASRLGAPFAVVAVNSTCLDLTGFIFATVPGKIWSLNANVTVAGASIQVFGSFNADPFVTFGVTTTNPTPGPMSYAFAFGTPVVPEPYAAASSTGGVSFTNGLVGQAAVRPVGAGNTYIKGYAASGASITNLGVDLGTQPCEANGAPLTVTRACPQGTATNTFPPTVFTSLLASLTYEQTDVASTASWSGAVTLTEAAAPPTSPVPEPSTLLLVAGGLAVAGVAARRRKA